MSENMAIYVQKVDKEATELKKNENDASRKKAERATKKYMKTVKEFIKSKNGGVIPPEWECPLVMLETYYQQFLQLTDEINNLDSFIVETGRGSSPNPLLSAQQGCSRRIETYLAEFGLTMKSASKMGVKEVKEEQSVLEKYLNQNLDK